MVSLNGSGSLPIGKRGSASFYGGVLRLLKRTRIPFRVGGTLAVNAYLNVRRGTKDMDVFCRAGDFPRLLKACAQAGYTTRVEDERWVAKIIRGRHYCDVIFGSANMVTSVSASWFHERHVATVMNVKVHLLPPTELIFSKMFIKDRYKYDGNDVSHLVLRCHRRIDWKRLLGYMDQHWEVLLVHLLQFRFVYPSERDAVPRWVLTELLNRLADQSRLPRPRKRVCRGRLFSRDDFEVDVAHWGFADAVGDDKRQ